MEQVGMRPLLLVRLTRSGWSGHPDTGDPVGGRHQDPPRPRFQASWKPGLRNIGTKCRAKASPGQGVGRWGSGR
jgi:hypothetical protein